MHLCPLLIALNAYCSSLSLPTLSFMVCFTTSVHYNRWFPETTGKDNLRVFSYSRRVKSPEWRWQQRRADLRHFEIFRHGPIVIYFITVYTSWGNLLSDMHIPREQWVFDQPFWCLFCLLFTGICHLAHELTVSPTKACLLCTTPGGMDLHIQVHAQRLLASAVPWISKDHLLYYTDAYQCR